MAGSPPRSSPHCSLGPDPQQPPRDPARPRPATSAAVVARDTAAAEADLAAKIAASPATLALYYQLARLQERRSAFKDAEATLLRAREVAPSDKDAAVALALFYGRHGTFEQTIAALETVAQLDAANPQAYLVIGTRYWDKVSSDKALPLRSSSTTSWKPSPRRIGRWRSTPIISRRCPSRASCSSTGRPSRPTRRRIKQLVAEADALRNRTLEINKTQGGRPMPNRFASQRAMGPAGDPGAMAPVRVGGNIGPSKVRDVKPVYPPEAQSAGIQGMVILEATRRRRRPRVRREGAALHSAARSGGPRCGPSVGVHAHAPERRSRAGHHDGHGELLAPVTEATEGTETAEQFSSQQCITRSNGGTEVIDFKTINFPFLRFSVPPCSRMLI